MILIDIQWKIFTILLLDIKMNKKIYIYMNMYVNMYIMKMYIILFNVLCKTLFVEIFLKLLSLILRDETYDLRTNLFNKEGCPVVCLIYVCLHVCICCHYGMVTHYPLYRVRAVLLSIPCHDVLLLWVKEENACPRIRS